jgi:LacI family transcriptional regulator
VAIDDRKAMREATRHLIALGHRRLLYLVRDTRLSTTQRRIEGLRDAARGAQSPVQATVLQRDPDETAFARQVTAALRGPHAPTALVASNSAIALSLLRTLQGLGVRWPGDVSVLSFDAPEWAQVVQPPLAVVRHPIRDIATAAWNRLLLRLRTPATPPTRITLDAHFVDGPSLAPWPAVRRAR